MKRRRGGTEIKLEAWRERSRAARRLVSDAAARLASALGVPVASLFTDELVVAEVRVSDDTLAEICRHGRPHSVVVSERIASRLEPLIWHAATRPPVDVSPGARPRRRRTRAEVLAGISEAGVMRETHLAAGRHRVAVPQGRAPRSRTEVLLRAPAAELSVECRDLHPEHAANHDR